MGPEAFSRLSPAVRKHYSVVDEGHVVLRGEIEGASQSRLLRPLLWIVGPL
ncbi:hypothetical protein DIPPA_01037 [Diplonema papillatum]|nr:hypothetical protein DIPPA_01037 [Diplonema papillatum]